MGDPAHAGQVHFLGSGSSTVPVWVEDKHICINFSLLLTVDAMWLAVSSFLARKWTVIWNCEPNKPFLHGLSFFVKGFVLFCCFYYSSRNGFGTVMGCFLWTRLELRWAGELDKAVLTRILKVKPAREANFKTTSDAKSRLCRGSSQSVEKTTAWWMMCGCRRHPGGVTKYFVSSHVGFRSCDADSGCRERKSLVLWLWWMLLFEKKAKNSHCLRVIRLSNRG